VQYGESNYSLDILQNLFSNNSHNSIDLVLRQRITNWELELRGQCNVELIDGLVPRITARFTLRPGRRLAPGEGLVTDRPFTPARLVLPATGCIVVFIPWPLARCRL
jgi:hypothetical protein